LFSSLQGENLVPGNGDEKAFEKLLLDPHQLSRMRHLI